MERVPKNEIREEALENVLLKMGLISTEDAHYLLK